MTRIMLIQEEQIQQDRREEILGKAAGCSVRSWEVLQGTQLKEFLLSPTFSCHERVNPSQILHLHAAKARGDFILIRGCLIFVGLLQSDNSVHLMGICSDLYLHCLGNNASSPKKLSKSSTRVKPILKIPIFKGRASLWGAG